MKIILVLIIALLIIPLVNADINTTVIYPAADSADGRATRLADGDFTNITNLAGDDYDYNIENIYAPTLIATTGITGNYTTSRRGVLKFRNTTTIPSNAIFDSVLVALWGNAQSNGLGNDSIDLVYMTNPVSNTSVAASDYQKRVRASIANSFTNPQWKLGEYNNFTLTNTSLVSLTGNTNFETILGWDLTNSTIGLVWASGAQTGFAWVDSTSAGTSHDPFMEIRWHLPAGAPDTTPPGSITGLSSTNTDCNSTTWVWTNPTDADFAGVGILKNGTWSNITAPTATAIWTGLPELTVMFFNSTTYDSSGNQNLTNWVNGTVTTDSCPIPTTTPTPTPTSTPIPTSTPWVAVTPYENNWCGILNLYFQDVPSGIDGYMDLTNYASGNPITDENITIQDSDGIRLINSYISQANTPGNGVILLEGLRQYNIYSYVSSISQPSYFTINVSRYNNITGTETFFYNITSTAISSETPALDRTFYVSPNSTLFTGDERLLIRIGAYTTRESATTIHFLNQGDAPTYVQSGFFSCPSSFRGHASSPSGIASPMPEYLIMVGLLGALLLWRRKT